MEYMFPFKRIPYGSRVIIYGAGQVGQEYLCQLRETGYAEVVCLIDRQAERYLELDIEVRYPNDIIGMVYDYVVIAVKNDIFAMDVIKSALQLGVPQDRIVCQLNHWPALEVVRDRDRWVGREELAVSLPAIIPIAVSIGGGIGDCLIKKRQLEELLSWDRKIVVDIYTTPKRYGVLKWLLKDTPQVNAIIGNISQLSYTKKEYAAAFVFGYSLDLLAWDSNKLHNNHCLIAKMKEIEKATLEYGLLDKGVLMSVEFSRADKDRLNFYTAYNRYGAFNVVDWHTQVPLSDEGKIHLQELLPKGRDYITISCGCDVAVGHNEVQAKAWPYAYWEELVHLLHEHMPNLVVVQVDGGNFPRLSGCDAYIVGENIDVAVQALHGSKVHIDNDGGLVHLATQLGTKCVVLFGPTPINYYGYKENINLQAGTCHNCYWLTGDSLSCYRHMDKPECMYSITPEIVLKSIKESLGIAPSKV